VIVLLCFIEITTPSEARRARRDDPKIAPTMLPVFAMQHGHCKSARLAMPLLAAVSFEGRHTLRPDIRSGSPPHVRQQ
jgi:hypothetical protein